MFSLLFAIFPDELSFSFSHVYNATCDLVSDKELIKNAQPALQLKLYQQRIKESNLGWPKKRQKDRPQFILFECLSVGFNAGIIFHAGGILLLPPRDSDTRPIIVYFLNTQCIIWVSLIRFLTQI